VTVNERLNAVLQGVFDNPDIQVTPETTADQVEGWDSLSHVNVILAIEQSFRIRFHQKEIMRLRNIGDLITCIESKLPPTA